MMWAVIDKSDVCIIDILNFAMCVQDSAFPGTI